MKAKTIVIIDKDEREKLAELAHKLRGICLGMHCADFECRADCPLDSISDHAHDLADEISKFLEESKGE